jgi:hypothetical protein
MLVRNAGQPGLLTAGKVNRKSGLSHALFALANQRHLPVNKGIR